MISASNYSVQIEKRLKRFARSYFLAVFMQITCQATIRFLKSLENTAFLKRCGFFNFLLRALIWLLSGKHNSVQT